jgi:putative flippase GtrA
MLRFLRFNVVGGIGFGVQMSMLALLVQYYRWPYLWATLAAVETAVLHNFLWHQRWTWRDRPGGGIRGTFSRLIRFHLLNGITSLVGNALAVTVLVESLQLPVMAAGATAVGVCSVANFLWGHYLIFRPDCRAGSTE